jgi:uncharacterized repeat protein (TIGR02543 family)
MNTSILNAKFTWQKALMLFAWLVGSLVATSSSFAAIAFDAASNGGLAASGSTFTWSHTVGTGTNRVLVVGVEQEDTNTADMTISSVTYNGAAMTAIANSQVSDGTTTVNRAQLFYQVNPASGAHNVVVTFAGTVNGASAGAVSLSGAAQSGPEAVATNHLGSGSTISTNITTLTAGAWVVDVIGSGASSVTFTTTTSGMTERWDRSTNGAGGAGSTKAPTATGATTLSWTASSGSRIVHALAAFAAASGGGTGPFTLTTTVSGSGSITRNPNASTYAAGTSVQLTAVPAAGWSFSGWSGAISGTTNPQSVIMDANKSVTATFTQNTGGPFTLTTTVVGTGTITRNPNATSYAAGTVVSLTATAGSGFTFTGWSGDLSGTTNPQNITMSANRNVTATFTSSGGGGDLFVAPNGTASNPGTQASPTTLESAITRIASGSTIWVRGGTYNYSTGITIAPGNNGTSSANKNVFNFGSEVPLYNFTGQATADANRGITVNGNFWHFKGIQVTHAGDNGLYIGGNNNTIELCMFAFNRDTGLQLGRASSSFTSISQWPSNNLILNCESHDNSDAAGENADGFACKLTTGTGNVFRGCISHHNSDDGWDLFTKTDTGPIGPVLIENCIAYHNGQLSNGTINANGDRNGFKLGGDGIAVQHTIRRSIAFDNLHHGFTDNNNPGPIQVVNNTSFNNTQSNFNFRSGGHSVFTNNASLNAGSSDATFDSLTGTTNLFWKSGASDNNGGTKVISASDFQSLTPPASFARNADGSINLGNFCKLASGSDLVNGGTPSGTDIGAVESF